MIGVTEADLSEAAFVAAVAFTLWLFWPWRK